MATQRSKAPVPRETMARPSGAQRAVAAGLTPNQVVAYNLARARRLRGWSQDQATAALEPHLGRRWSKASLSQAERAVTGKVPRSFDADELVAFARAFKLPVAWFLIPPTPTELSTIPGPSIAVSEPGGLVDVVLGDDTTAAALTDRLTELFADLHEDQLTASQRRLGQLVRAESETIADVDYRRMMQLETQLLELTANTRRLTDKLRRDRAQRDDRRGKARRAGRATRTANP